MEEEDISGVRSPPPPPPPPPSTPIVLRGSRSSFLLEALHQLLPLLQRTHLKIIDSSFKSRLLFATSYRVFESWWRARNLEEEDAESAAVADECLDHVFNSLKTFLYYIFLLWNLQQKVEDIIYTSQEAIADLQGVERLPRPQPRPLRLTKDMENILKSSILFFLTSVIT